MSCQECERLRNRITLLEKLLEEKKGEVELQEALHICEEDIGSKWWQWSGIIITQRARITLLEGLVRELMADLDIFMHTKSECLKLGLYFPFAKDFCDEVVKTLTKATKVMEASG
jgi:hypothetical protein